MSDPPDSGDPGFRRLFADVLSFGWVLPASIAAGAGLGFLLDKVLGLFPVLTAALAVVGLAAGLRQIYRESEALSDRKDRRGDGPPDGG